MTTQPELARLTINPEHVCTRFMLEGVFQARCSCGRSSTMTPIAADADAWASEHLGGPVIYVDQSSN